METYQLTEKIYTSDESQGLSEVQAQLSKFFQELISRKKGASVKDGLNAGMVLFPNSWAAKVNENNGTDYHSTTNMNLVRFLNGENVYYTEQQAAEVALSPEETRKVVYEGMQISILSNEQNCKVLIFSYNNTHSLFQLSVLEELLQICEQIKDQYDNNMVVGFCNRSTMMEEDKIENVKERIQNLIEEKKANQSGTNQSHR